MQKKKYPRTWWYEVYTQFSAYIFIFLGNEHSIAIVANDGIHFCKGTCKEESQMWLDILRLFPTATVMGPGRATGNGGRAKRSATFPGIRIMSPASRFANNKAALSAMTNKNAEGNEVEDADVEDGDVDDMAGKDFFLRENDYS